MQYFTVVNTSGKTIKIEDHAVPTGTAVVVTTAPDLVDLVEGVDLYIVVNQVGPQASVQGPSVNPRKSFTRISDKLSPPVVPEKPVNMDTILDGIDNAEASIAAEVNEVSAPSVQTTREAMLRKKG